MRTHGTITRWNDERGFGFISPAGGKAEVFVHISAFPKDGIRPQVGELISYMVEAGQDGRQRAVGVMRPGQRTVQRPSPGPSRSRTPGRRSQRPSLARKFATSVTPVLVVSLALYAWSRFETDAPAEAPDRLGLVEEPTAQYSCDGRTMCSQMGSCAEAEYFIRNCPATEMDGDGDGVPCERQWCN